MGCARTRAGGGADGRRRAERPGVSQGGGDGHTAPASTMRCRTPSTVRMSSHLVGAPRRPYGWGKRLRRGANEKG